MTDAATGSRRFLVILRAGDSSLHPGWLQREGPARAWDLHISYFGKRTQPFGDLPEGVSLSFDAGQKYIGLDKFVNANWDFVSHYDFVAFPDDDLQVVAGDWSALFAKVEESGAILAQPSLDPRSYFSHDVTLRRPQFDYRYVDFVEVMTPVFSKAFLATVRETFAENTYSWGLDYLWADRVKAAGGRMAIVDSTALLHTRRVGGGAQYKGAGQGGAAVARDELHALLAKYGLAERQGRAVGAVTTDGRRINTSLLLNNRQIKPRVFRKFRDAMKLNTVQI